MLAFDAIAVGGGLAGAAFALELARQGLRVAVIERTRKAQLKVCGDFLSTEARQLLGYLGLDVAALGAAPVTTLRFATGRQCASARLPFAAAGISRLCLDEALLAQAQSAGVEIFRGEAATALEPGAQSVTVHAGAKVFQARWAALATGKHNVRGWPRASGSMTSFKVQLALTPEASRALSGVVQLVSYRGGYIGACNVEDGNATICWLMDERAMQRIGADWTAHLAHLSRQSPYIGDLLSGARFLSPRPAAVSAVPYGYRRREVVGPGVFPVGDQLSVIPSFTGEGTSLALSSGIAAARAVLSGSTAGDFQKAFLARTRAQLFWAQAIDASFKSAATRVLGVKIMGALPPLASTVANLTRVKGFEELTVSQP